jgi:GntR family transcriptional repressor for pyruvate dehydrogenase complex
MMKKAIYQRIKPSTVPEKIILQVQQLIKDGQLQPNEQLPSEREFAELLGVGRPSLREALSTLETLGFVEIKKRQGIFVKNVSNEMVMEPLRHILREDNRTLFHLYEIRKDIELSSAFLAAQRRTDSDLEAIEQPIVKMEADTQNGGFTLTDDLNFHLSIAQATHNFLRVHILKHIFDLADDFLCTVLESLSQENDNLPLLCCHHRQVFEAIKSREAERSRNEMATHLEWVEKQWMRIINSSNRRRD